MKLTPSLWNNTNINKKKFKALPNCFELSKLILASFPNLKYCLVTGTFFNYVDEQHMWVSINNDLLKSMILNFINANFQDFFYQINPRKVDEIIFFLRQTSFNLIESKNKANSNGILIPFINGVLNSKTLEFLPHNFAFYNTYCLPIAYKSNDSLVDTLMGKFLAEIVSYNPMALNILRACLFLIFTNNLKYQRALFIYGPGGSGKSTLINILMFLLGVDAAVSASFNNINSRFGRATLRNKILFVINELPQIFSYESSFLKSLIGIDPMQLEEKFKENKPWIPTTFLIIISNTLWTIKNITSGFTRRFIYMPFNNIPLIKQSNLFNLKSNNTADGLLLESLPAFVNWILSCPQEYLDYLKLNGDEISNLINPNNQIHINPLKVWVDENLTINPDSQLELGAKPKFPAIWTLYGSYRKWAEINMDGLPVLTPQQFGPALFNLLLSIHIPVRRIRLKTGVFYTGIAFSDDSNKTLSKNQTLKNKVDINDLDFSNHNKKN